MCLVCEGSNKYIDNCGGGIWAQVPSKRSVGSSYFTYGKADASRISLSHQIGLVFFVQLGLNTSAWLWFLLPAMLLFPDLEGFPACQSLKAPSALPGLLCCLGLPALLVSYADIELCICILRLEHTELMGSFSLNAVVAPHTHSLLFHGIQHLPGRAFTLLPLVLGWTPLGMGVGAKRMWYVLQSYVAVFLCWWGTQTMWKPFHLCDLSWFSWWDMIAFSLSC